MFTSQLQDARDGSNEALGQILESCREYISAIATTKVPIRLRGQLCPSSLVQETYARACKKFSQFRGKSEQQLFTWLRQILIHCLLNELRKRRHQLSRQELNPAVEGYEQPPSKSLEQQEEAEKIWRAIRRLEPRDQLVIELRHFGQMKFEEIATLLNISTVNTRQIWGRAQMRLGEELRSQ